MKQAATRVVVIGNGMVGHRFVEMLAATDADVAITVLCEEPRPAYDRVQLTSFLSGRSANDLSMVQPGFFEEHNIALHVGDRAVEIDRNTKLLHTAKGQILPWDKLVLATGSAPFVPPVPGHNREACFVYRTIEDLEAIRDEVAAVATANATIETPRPPRGAVIGGGLLGLEAARALQRLGVETHVIELAPRLMAVQLDDTGAAFLRRKIEALGVHVHLGKNTTEIVDGQDARHRMYFADGQALDADLIVFTAGIRPRDALAGAANLQLGARGGIAINHFCLTSDENIYAIGECASWQGKVFGLEMPGYEMARVCATHIAGNRDAVFAGADTSTKLRLPGMGVASLGDAHVATPSARVYSFVDHRNGVYKKLVVSEDQSRPLGAVLVGDTDSYATFLHLILSGDRLPDNAEELILPPCQKQAAAESATPADAAQGCSSNHVS